MNKGIKVDPALVKKTFIGVIEILTAGMFVYFGLQVKWSLGDPCYFSVALIALAIGIGLAYSRG